MNTNAGLAAIFIYTLVETSFSLPSHLYRSLLILTSFTLLRFQLEMRTLPIPADKMTFMKQNLPCSATPPRRLGAQMNPVRRSNTSVLTLS